MSNKLRSFLIVVISIAVVMAALPMNAFRVNADSITVYFDGNGGERPITNPEDDATKWAHVSDDQGKVTIDSNSAIGFTREGYVFESWNEKSTGDGATYTIGTEYHFTENTTIYAKWAKVCNITFEPDYPTDATDTFGSMETQEVVEGVAEPLNANQFKCTGYRFNGWKDNDTSLFPITLRSMLSGNRFI